MMSGPVGVESDSATNSRQFYPAFGISCEYLEWLDLHLYARHQSNIGHFLQPRWSTWSGKWGRKFWPRFSKVIFIYSYFSKKTVFISLFQNDISPKTGRDNHWFQEQKNIYLLVWLAFLWVSMCVNRSMVYLFKLFQQLRELWCQIFFQISRSSSW